MAKKEISVEELDAKLKEISDKLDEDKLYELCMNLYYGGYEGRLNGLDEFTVKEQGIIGTALANFIRDFKEHPVLIAPKVLTLCRKLTKGIKFKEWIAKGYISPEGDASE